MSLISDLRDAEDSQIPDRGLIGRSNGPGIHQSGVNHHDADNAAKENVSAKYPCGGNCDQNGQQCECGIGHHVQKTKPAAACKRGNCLGQCFHKAHHQTGSHDCGKNRDEHIAWRFQDFLPQGHFGSCRFLHVILGCRGNTGNRKEFLVDLVDGACADNQLQLSVGFEHAFHAVDVFERRPVDLAVVSNNKTKPRCTMCSADDIGAAADIGSDLLRTFPVIESHG